MSKPLCCGDLSLNSPNADAQQKPIRSQSREHTGRIRCAVGACAEGSEDEKDDGGNEQGPFSRVCVGRVSEYQLAEDCVYFSKCRNIV